MEHIFSVDVEDYFQVSAFESTVERKTWDGYPSRVVRNTEIILDMLAEHNATGTFFTLGWVADRHPHLVKKIVDAGHEIASHGWWHQRITSMTPEQFREDVYSSKALLEDVSGKKVLGYRAPSFSITPKTEWALDILLETGYRYDSSLFPISRKNYGFPDTPPLPHVLHRERGELLEFPLATLRIGPRLIPAAGGGYIRHFPYSIIRKAFRDHTANGIPGVFYIHPWEIDPEQPRLEVSPITRVRHYRNLGKTQGRVSRLLSEFKFTSIVDKLGENTTIEDFVISIESARAGMAMRAAGGHS